MISCSTCRQTTSARPSPRCLVVNCCKRSATLEACCSQSSSVALTMPKSNRRRASMWNSCLKFSFLRVFVCFILVVVTLIYVTGATPPFRANIIYHCLILAMIAPWSIAHPSHLPRSYAHPVTCPSRSRAPHRSVTHTDVDRIGSRVGVSASFQKMPASWVA